MAEVKVTLDPASTPEEPIFNFEIPGGQKGDPGGFTAGIEIGTAHLDTLLTPGLYKQSISANVTLAAGYPAGIVAMAEKRCTVEVTQWGAAGYVRHRIAGIEMDTGVATAEFKRTKRSIAPERWSSWAAASGMWVDNTAGKAVRIWDAEANRWQMMFADTGYRDISTLITVGSVVAAKLRRYGANVEISIVTFIPPTNGTVQIIAAGLLNGFRALHTVPALAINNTTGMPAAAVYSAGIVTLYGAVAGNSYHITAMAMSADGWPTTLPGAASGTIPNT